MVAINVDLRCVACDGVDLKTIERDGEEIVVCPFCESESPLAYLKERLDKENAKFQKEGITAIEYKKSGWFL